MFLEVFSIKDKFQCCTEEDPLQRKTCYSRNSLHKGGDCQQRSPHKRKKKTKDQTSPGRNFFARAFL